MHGEQGSAVMFPVPGFVIAAPASGSGKTLVTLALLRAFRNAGVRVGSFKTGPDYIDPCFHTAASGKACPNLDPWAMRPETIATIAADITAGAGPADGEGAGAGLVIGEGVMGLFDGAADGSGSTADLAIACGLPVVLLVDAGGMADSAGALLRGFCSHRAGLRIAGVIFNRVGGTGHRAALARAVADLPPRLIGFLPREEDLTLPARHLGLIQAREHGALDAFLDRAAAWVAQNLDLTALRGIASDAAGAAAVMSAASSADAAGDGCVLPPLGQRIAVARDDGFAFAYPHLLDSWRIQGAEIMFFSPLADAPPPAGCDAVYLPGGYPELFAGQIAAAATFMAGLRDAAARGLPVYGECGGYMVLGDGLIDAAGVTHRMAGLLPLVTSFASRALHLGYRRATLAADHPFGKAGAEMRGHEFHYATIAREGPGVPLFRDVENARGEGLPDMGRCAGPVTGSFLHLIDRAA